MCLFKLKKLQKTIDLLEFNLGVADAKHEETLKKVDSLSQEVTAKRNIIRQQDERIEKLTKRIKTQQAIIEKQNAKLGVEPKKKTRKVEDKEHDPYIE